MKASKIVYGARFLANCPKNTDLRLQARNDTLINPTDFPWIAFVSHQREIFSATRQTQSQKLVGPTAEKFPECSSERYHWDLRPEPLTGAATCFNNMEISSRVHNHTKEIEKMVKWPKAYEWYFMSNWRKVGGNKPTRSIPLIKNRNCALRYQCSLSVVIHMTLPHFVSSVAEAYKPSTELHFLVF